MEKILRGYIFSRHFMGERVPQNVQNIVIRDYCQRNNIKFLLSSTEYAMSNCNLMLSQTIDELDDINGIVAYSLFQLPSHHAERKELVERVLMKQREIHFALENLIIKDRHSMEKVELIWSVKQTEVDCLKTQELATLDRSF